MTGRVIVVGSVNIDLVLTAPRLPSAGETVTGGQFAQHDGGKGGNQAVAAARLGLPVALVAATGDDAFGAAARAALAAEAVDVDEVGTLRGEATGVAVVIVGPDGENLIAVASGANALLTPEAVRSSLERRSLGPGDVVLVGHEIPTVTARTALTAARRAGASTVFNPAPADGLDRSVFGLADVLTPNRGELASLVAAESGRVGRPFRIADDAVAAARTLVDRSAEGDGPGAVLVSLGAVGAVLVRPSSRVVEIPAPSVEAVDATGAGDALNGALAALLAAGLDLVVAAERAVVAASLSTTRPGARGGLPTANELAAADAQWPPTAPAQTEKT